MAAIRHFAIPGQRRYVALGRSPARSPDRCWSDTPSARRLLRAYSGVQSSPAFAERAPEPPLESGGPSSVSLLFLLPLLALVVFLVLVFFWSLRGTPTKRLDQFQAADFECAGRRRPPPRMARRFARLSTTATCNIWPPQAERISLAASVAIAARS